MADDLVLGSTPTIHGGGAFFSPEHIPVGKYYGYEYFA